MYRLLSRGCIKKTYVKAEDRWIVADQHRRLSSIVYRYAATRRRRSSTLSSSPTNTAHSPALRYDPEEIFNFTRGRFISDERRELRCRHRTFNVDELAHRAAQAVNASHCISVKKYPDGMYNRTLLLSMDNGKEVVAKIPNPNSGPPHFTTASEVATMRFAREVLGTPLPEVYAWSSRVQEDTVGSEYIIMQRLPGIELEKVWPNMGIRDRLQVVKSVAEYQKAWSSISFKKFGSLYFAEDLDAQGSPPLKYTNREGEIVEDRRFAIGPSCGREYFDDRRDGVSFDRGPWKCLKDYHTAIGERELTCIQQVTTLPPSPVTLRGPGLYQPTHEKKANAVKAYLKLMRFLLPQDRSLASAHMWHGDLHGGNIFVDPDDPTKVVGLIDWQSTEIMPLYFHARQPHFVDYDGPQLYGLERPSLPSNLEQLEPRAQREAQDLYSKQSLCALYRTIIHQECPRMYQCFEFQQTATFSLLLLARNLLVDGEAAYLYEANNLEKTWDTLPGTQGTPFSLHFSPEEKQVIVSDMEAAALGIEVMSSIRENLGELFPPQGYVPHDQYEEAIYALSQMREQVIAQFARNSEESEAWQDQWPFRR